MAKKPIKITEVALRDAHQSLIATRMTMDEMRPILPAMDEVGYYSVECWGGATFDSCIRFLDEDPWDRLRMMRKEMPNTKLQMLFRGQNMLGYRHYADDVVEYFVAEVRCQRHRHHPYFRRAERYRATWKRPSKPPRRKRRHVQGCICYTAESRCTTTSTSSSTPRPWRRWARDSICIKDMAGLLTPYSTYELVKALKETVKIPVEHPHPLHLRPCFHVPC